MGTNFAKKSLICRSCVKYVKKFVVPVGLDGLEGNREDGLDSGHALVHVTVLLAHPVLQHLNSMEDSRLIHLKR